MQIIFSSLEHANKSRRSNRFACRNMEARKDLKVAPNHGEGEVHKFWSVDNRALDEKVVQIVVEQW